MPALQKIPPGTAKAAAAGSSGKGKGSKQKVAEEGAAAKAAAPKQSRRVASKPAAGMISQLGRRLLHMRIMLCELLACLTCALTRIIKCLSLHCIEVCTHCDKFSRRQRHGQKALSTRKAAHHSWNVMSVSAGEYSRADSVKGILTVRWTATQKRRQPLKTSQMRK